MDGNTYKKLENTIYLDIISNMYSLIQDSQINIFLESLVNRILIILEENSFNEKIRQFKGAPFNTLIRNVLNLFNGNLKRSNKTFFENQSEKIIADLNIRDPEIQYELISCYYGIYGLYYISFEISHIMKDVLNENEIYSDSLTYLMRKTYITNFIYILLTRTKYNK